LGVTLTAVAAMLVSALLVIAVVLLLAVRLLHPQPDEPGPAAFWATIVPSLAIAVWGISTALGLLRLRRWSRWSVLIFSALLILYGVTTALLMTVIPFPANADPAMVTLLKAAIGGFFAAVALIGAFWLIYFNRSGVRAQFGSGRAVSGEISRPVSISIIAWLFLIGGVFFLGAALLSFPIVVFGLLIGGWPSRVLSVLFAAFNLWVGTGLLRLKPLSRVLAMAFLTYGVVNMALLMGLPGSERRMRAGMESVPAVLRGPAEYRGSPTTAASMMLFGLGFGVVSGAIQLWFLYTRRAAFVRPAAGTESSPQ
jgi:hypothetical protein